MKKIEENITTCNTKSKKNKMTAFILLSFLVTALVMFGDTYTEPVHACAYGGSTLNITGVISNAPKSSGVSSFDGAMNRGDKFIKSIVKRIGFWVALIAAIFFFISFPAHQSEMRITAAIAFIVGIAVYFAPEIIEYILGTKNTATDTTEAATK